MTTTVPGRGQRGDSAVLVETPVLVEETARSGDVRIRVHQCLDLASGQLLLDAADAVAADGGERITVDLRPVTGFTEAGVAAASECCRLASGLPGGVSFLVSAGSSRRALLAILDCR